MSGENEKQKEDSDFLTRKCSNTKNKFEKLNHLNIMRSLLIFYLNFKISLCGGVAQLVE